MPRAYLQEVLAKYIPTKAVGLIADWIIENRIKVKITKSRSSKLGDFRPAWNGSDQRITINYNLNKYSFLITLVHELAHLKVWQKHQNKASPHGSEWKKEYKHLMSFFLHKHIFPADIDQALAKYMNNPAAASCSDINLLRILKKHDPRGTGVIHLEEAPENCVFKLENGQVFQKGEKRRTRYHCIEVGTKRPYTVSSLAEVVVLPEKPHKA